MGSSLGNKSNTLKPPKVNQADENEEIASSDEEEEQLTKYSSEDDDEEENTETPQDKRLKLAKLYLEEIEKEEKSRAEDKELIENNLSERLTNEYLDSVGRLRRKVADEYVGVDSEKIARIKHKLHKLPVTCVCLTSDNKFLFTGDKSATVLKWNFETMKVVGNVDSNFGRSADEEYSKKKRRSQIYALAVTTDSKFLVSFSTFFCFLILKIY